MTPSNRGFFEVHFTVIRTSFCAAFHGLYYRTFIGPDDNHGSPLCLVPFLLRPIADVRPGWLADEILPFEHADLLISKQKLERAKGIELVRIKREKRTQDLCFSSRPFVLCGLPVRRLPKNQLLYERRSGRFLLQITGQPEFGVPFGQDRLVPIFLATLAVQQKIQVIRFRTAAEMLESFGMHTGGKEYRRLVGAFERIFGATIFFGTDTLSGRATMVQRCRFNFMREAQIWYSRVPDQRTLSSEFENVIVLSDEFYQELIAHPVPNDLEAVKMLAASPAVLDLFMWLSYRCFTAKGEESVPLFGDFGLANQIGTTDYSRPRRFRAMIHQWLDNIRALWPDCPARISPNGQAILVKHSPAVLPAESAGGRSSITLTR